MPMCLDLQNTEHGLHSRTEQKDDQRFLAACMESMEHIMQNYMDAGMENIAIFLKISDIFDIFDIYRVFSIFSFYSIGLVDVN